MGEQKRVCENCRYFEKMLYDPNEGCYLLPDRPARPVAWCGEHRYEGELTTLPTWSRYDGWEDTDKLKRGVQ